MQKDPNLRPKCQDLLKFKLFTLYPRIGSKPAPSTTTPKKPAWLILSLLLLAVIMLMREANYIFKNRPEQAEEIGWCWLIQAKGRSISPTTGISIMHRPHLTYPMLRPMAERSGFSIYPLIIHNTCSNLSYQGKNQKEIATCIHFKGNLKNYSSRRRKC